MLKSTSIKQAYGQSVIGGFLGLPCDNSDGCEKTLRVTPLKISLSN